MRQTPGLILDHSVGVASSRCADHYLGAKARFIRSLPLMGDHVPLSRWHDRAETTVIAP